jgi:HAD superfamily hydrolase (TIGR01450 family)
MREVVASRGDLSNVTTVVCDLDGVVYLDGGEIPGSGAALSALRAAGKRLLFVTNNATKSVGDVVGAVETMSGFTASEADVITSSLVTALAMQGRAEQVLVVGGSALADTLRGQGLGVTTDWRRADAVAVGMDFELTYDKLAAAALAIRSGAAFYATNADATYPSRDGLTPGGGAIVAALQAATEVEPIVCGKPHQPTADAVQRLAGSEGVLVVGDRYDTDIALGRKQGWATALVLSGVTPRDAPAPPDLEADVIIDRLADLPPLLGVS